MVSRRLLLLLSGVLLIALVLAVGNLIKTDEIIFHVNSAYILQPGSGAVASITEAQTNTFHLKITSKQGTSVKLIIKDQAGNTVYEEDIIGQTTKITQIPVKQGSQYYLHVYSTQMNSEITIQLWEINTQPIIMTGYAALLYPPLIVGGSLIGLSITARNENNNRSETSPSVENENHE
ncbi:MAG: hypothetical protein F7C36_03075 [Desulfurococcales archaeon]|nr:hypothetical protein [Desulfurococcales archaeon]